MWTVQINGNTIYRSLNQRDAMQYYSIAVVQNIGKPFRLIELVYNGNIIKANDEA